MRSPWAGEVETTTDTELLYLNFRMLMYPLCIMIDSPEIDRVSRII